MLANVPQAIALPMPHSRHACCAGAIRGAFALPGTERQYERPLPFTVEHLALDLHLDETRRQVEGTAVLHVERLTEGASDLLVDAVDFELRAVEVDYGAGFDPARYDYDERVLQVAVRKSARNFCLRVRYVAYPKRGLYFLAPDEFVPERPVQVWSQCQDEDARHWIPCIDKPHVKQTLKLSVTAAQNRAVLSNGHQETAPLRSGRRGASSELVHTFRLEQPLPSYLITLVIGDFTLVSDRSAKLPSGREVPIRYLVPPGSEADARRAFSGTPRMVELFSRLTGVEYPYELYTQIVVSDFIFGGMENTTATTMYEHVLLDERAAIDIESHDLVAHELAHQWFGDWVTCKDWTHAWLNEGFATFFEILEAEDRLGRDEYLLGVERALKTYLTESGGRYDRPIVCRDYQAPIDLFDRHLYEKGGLVLHMLRTRLGDETFWTGVRLYLERFGRAHVQTRDLQACLEQAAGRTLERFFDEWVHRPGHPQLKVKLTWKDKAVVLELIQEQTHPFELEFELEIMTSKGHIKRVPLRTCQSREVFNVALPARPRYVAFDPEWSTVGQITLETDAAFARDQLLHGQSARVRRQAANWLAGRVDEQTRQALASTLQDDSTHYSVRTSAADAISKSHFVDGHAVLCQALGARDARVRASAATALGAYRLSAVHEALKRRLSRERSYLVRAAILKALGRSESPEATALIKPELSAPSWGSVVASAGVEGLVALNAGEEAKTVAQLAQYGNPAALRRTAISQLPQLASTKETVRVLGKLLRDPDPHVRASVVAALGRAGGRSAKQLLSEHQPLETDGRVARRLGEALRSLRTVRSERDALQRIETLERDVQELKSQLAHAEANASRTPNRRK